MAISEQQNAKSTENNFEEGQKIQTWSPLRRAFFRFVCVYLVAYNLPFPLTVLPQGCPPYDNALNTLTVWVGKHIFHRVVDVTPSGSGDTAAAWVRVFCYLVAALLATIVWTVLDRKRPHYDRLYDWLRVYVRFALAATMIYYGAVKITPTQFAPPSLDRLMEPFGDASPMGLLWTFMGASPAYQVFGGLLEMLGALLLTTRHTTLLGSLLLTGVLSNVVALNFCYDVPAKIDSVDLLLMAVFLASPFAGRLFDLFVRGQAVGPIPPHPLFQNRLLNRGALVLKTSFVLGLVGMALLPCYQTQEFNRTASKSPLYGVWVVDQWNIDGVSHPPLITDTMQWHHVVLDNPMRLGVQTVSGARQRYFLTPNAPPGTFVLKRADDPTWSSTLFYAEPKPNLLTLKGALDGHQVRVKLHHENAHSFLLVRRGFHWVNEFPYNQ